VSRQNMIPSQFFSRCEMNKARESNIGKTVIKSFNVFLKSG